MKGEGVAWDFFIAEKLGKTINEVMQMTEDEYQGWIDWFGVKSVLTDLQRRTEEHRRGSD